MQRRTKGITFVVALLALVNLPAVVANDFVAELSRATNHYEWARLSRLIEREGVTVGKSNAAAFVRHLLVRMSTADFKNREVIGTEVIDMGQQAVPTLIDAITNAANPAPIFRDSAVANIPIFTMQLASKGKIRETVPALIDFIDKFQTDFYAVGADGKRLNQVVGTLIEITGQDFGTNKIKWRKWYDETRNIGQGVKPDQK